MKDFDRFEKIRVQLDGHVALVELCDPPHNFFSLDLVGETADAYEALDEVPECRAIVLAAKGSLWLFVLGMLGFVAAFAKYGCLSH